MKRLLNILVITGLLTLCVTGCKIKKEESKSEEKTNEKVVSVEEIVLNSTVNIYTPDKEFGAGFAIDDGYIITNYHVISSNKDNIIVVTFDKNENKAILIGYDEKNDIAVLKIDKELKPLTLGDSNNLKPGDKVTAIGNPNGDLSFSRAPGKILEVDEKLLNFIDAKRHFIYYDGDAISGYSGGPVYNEKGEIIGVLNNRYFGDLSKYEYDKLCGIIPINTVKDILNTILK